MSEKRTHIVFAWISFFVILVCVLLPFFSFFNYRLYMIPYLLISFLALLCTSKDQNTKRDRVIGTIIIIIAIFTVLRNSGYKTYLFCSAICIIMAIIMMMENIGGISVAVGWLTLLITVGAQLITIFDYYSSYQTAISGTVYLPWADIPDRLLRAVRDETGMLIVFIAMNMALLAYILSKREKQGY